MEPTSAFLDSLRPAGSKRSGKRDLIVNVFLRQEGHLTADDLVRSDPPRRSQDQPRHRVPHASVDGGSGHRAEGRFRRRALPLRALVPPPAALSSHLQDLQSVVRVPELRHRGAARGGCGGAQFHRRGRASCRFTAPASPAARAARRRREGGTTELLFARDALRIAIATERSGLEFYSRGARMTKDARGRRVFEKLAAEEKEHLGKLEARYKELLTAGSAARIAADVPVLQGSGQRPVRRRRRAARQGRRRSPGADDRHPVRARVAPVLQALRRSVRGLRRQADLPRVRHRRARTPRAADPRVSRAARAPADAARAAKRRKSRRPHASA